MPDTVFEFMRIEDYVRTEMESPYRREYLGEFAYPLHGTTEDAYGTSAAHNLIGGNVMGALFPTVRQLDLRLYAYRLKLYIAQSKSFFYPDLMVTRPKPQPDLTFGPDHADYFATDPCLLVEITCEDTDHRDKATKLGLYTAIPSLQTYLIVEQDERRVYAYQRENNWEVQEYAVQGDIFIPCLGRSLSLDEIYVGVR